MTTKSLRIWSFVHTWSSLLCTLFLLVICLTGLPLLFEDQIRDWLSTDPPYADVPPDAPRASLDDLVAQARSRYPKEATRFIFIDDDEPKVVIGLSPAQNSEQRFVHSMKFDAHTGVLLVDRPAADKAPATFVRTVRRLHTDLFSDLPGALFQATMGLLFVIALVSGVVLYAPFMRKLAFGTVRADRSRRIRWLDLHNLLGIATLAWMLVVGLTGILNELNVPLFGLWRATDLAALTASNKGIPLAQNLSAPQVAFDTVHALLPDRTISSIIYPTTSPFGSPIHFVVWTKGNQPLTARLFTPVLLDAETGKLNTVLDLPWYLRALELSRPLHFGDYGGAPLKIIWVILDCMTITVLISGLYLWMRRKVKHADGASKDPIMTPAEPAE